MGFVFLTQQSVCFLLSFVYRSIRWQMFFKIGVFKNFASFKGKHLCWSLILIKLQAWFAGTLSKRDSNTIVFCESCEVLRTPFYRTPTVATSAFIRSTHALWIKLICRNFGMGTFLWILQNFKKHYWPPLVDASFCHRM